MMKLFSTKYSNQAFSLAMLLLRVALGALMIPHGYDKLLRFSSLSEKFVNLFHMGSFISLSLTIFAEFFCSVFIIMGLFTRLAALPLIFTMCVAIFVAHGGQIFGDGEHAALFLMGYLVLLLVGPGKASMDHLIGK